MSTTSNYNLKFLVKASVVAKQESTVYFVPAEFNKRGKYKWGNFYMIKYRDHHYDTAEAAMKNTWRPDYQYLDADGKIYYKPYVVLKFADNSEYIEFFKDEASANMFAKECEKKSAGIWLK